MNRQGKSAFIAIVGCPNVGKSSLLNYILGEKIAIVSNKPQTTRTKITGVVTENDYQLVFIDTPGMHKPKTSLGKYMVRSINHSVAGVDLCLLVVELGKEPNETELQLIERFKQIKCPAILAINKIDKVKNKEDILEQIINYNSLFDFEAIVPISATKGDGVSGLVEELKTMATEEGHFFDKDTITDQPEKVIVAEIIREKMLKYLNKEVPHGVAVVIEKMKQRENKDIIDIDAVIYCERDTHKGIIIGKGGSMLKRISIAAREDIENFLNSHVNLQTWVKAKEDWRNKDGLLRNFGYNQQDFN